MMKFLNGTLRVLLYYGIIQYMILISLDIKQDISPTINFNVINITINALLSGEILP